MSPSNPPRAHAGLPVSAGWSAPWIGAALLVPLLLLAVAIGLTQLQLREVVRSQIARRDATLLAGLLKQQLRDTGDESTTDPLSAVLETTRLPQLPGVRSVIVYSPAGEFLHAWPLIAASVPLDPDLRQEASVGNAAARFYPARPLALEFISSMGNDSQAEPLLEVLVTVPDPLKAGAAGFARFLLDGSGMAIEFAQLDATLRRQAAWTFSLAGIASTAVLGLAFRQLSRANERLRRANQELTLAGKTSAVGAVASHLIHGLKNPLSGLQSLLRNPEDSADPGSDRTDAAALTRRMRGMIDDVARVLREDSGFAGYEVEAADLFTVLHQRLQPEALQHQQRLEFQSNHPLTLPNRDANLVLLILENLGHNALQAAPPGSALQVALSGTESAAIFSVIDSGPGLPMDIQERLFSPVISTKPGGTGIGLALSRQLARHMGADLRLVKTGSAGTEFALLLPLPRPTSA